MEHSENINELGAALAKAQNYLDQEREFSIIKTILNKKFNSNQSNNKTNLTKFLEKVAFGATDCWYWIGSINKHGYGMTSILGENKSHRISWRLFNGEITGGLSVLHKCDIRFCVNPEHLFLGSQLDNMRDCSNKGRIKSTPQYGEDNPMSKLSASAVEAIRKLLPIKSQAQIAREFNVSPMTISRIATGASWKTV